jgi:hypothetical protein
MDGSTGPTEAGTLHGAGLPDGAPVDAAPDAPRDGGVGSGEGGLGCYEAGLCLLSGTPSC